MNNRPAGFTVRLIASLLDCTIGFLPPMLLLLLVSKSKYIPELGNNVALFLVFGLLPFMTIWLWYTIPFVHFFGGTLGKLITGLRVTDTAGKHLVFKRNLFRHSIGYQFSSLLFGLGFFWIIKDPNKQGWHDHAAGSKVVIVNNLWPVGLIVLVVILFMHFFIIGSIIINFNKSPLKQDFSVLLEQSKIEGQEEVENIDFPPLKEL